MELRTTTQQAVEAKTREAEDAARTPCQGDRGEARGLRGACAHRPRGTAQGARTPDRRPARRPRQARRDLRARQRALGHAARYGGGAVDTTRGPRRAAARRGERTSSCIRRRRSTAAVPIPPVSENGTRAGAGGRRSSRGSRAVRLRSRQRPPSPPPTSVRCSRSCVPNTPTPSPRLHPTTRPASRHRPTPATPPRRPKQPWPRPADDEDDDGRRGSRARRRPRDGRPGRRPRRDRRGSGAAGQARGPGRAERPPRRPAPPAREDRHQQGPPGRTSRWPGGRTCSSRPSTPPTRVAPPPCRGPAGVGAAPRELLTELSTSVVSPLRERLVASLEQIDARTPADTEIAVAQSLGARYREWRGEQLEGALGDALAVALVTRVFDAAPDGARLRWVPAVVRQVPRLRRQRARAHREGTATSRPASRTRPRTPAAAASSVARSDAVARAPRRRAPLHLGCCSDARPDRRAPATIPFPLPRLDHRHHRRPGRAAVQPARAGRLLHRLPVVRLARPGHHLEQPPRGPGRARRSCSRSCSS